MDMMVPCYYEDRRIPTFVAKKLYLKDTQIFCLLLRFFLQKHSFIKVEDPKQDELNCRKIIIPIEITHDPTSGMFLLIENNTISIYGRLAQHEPDMTNISTIKEFREKITFLVEKLKPQLIGVT